jgi:glycosyltransferase involved in cell wall biosynthesis
MADALEKILQNDSDARDLATRAKEEAQVRFHPKIVARQHIRIYEEVLGAKNS